MNLIARSYKYRLYPTADQEQMLSAWQSACLTVQKACVLERRFAWRDYLSATEDEKEAAKKLLPSWASQGRKVTRLRESFVHINDVPRIMMTEIVIRVEEAYKKARDCWKQGKKAKVRWSDKPSQIGLSVRGEKYGTVLVSSTKRFGYWKLDCCERKLGLLKTRMHRAMPPGTEVKQAHITRAADGWYISFSCLIPTPEPLPSATKEVNGVDLNVKHIGNEQDIAAVDDGKKYRTTDNLKISQKRLATLQKLVSNRRTRGKAKHADPKSKRTAKRRKRIARLHQRITRQREHVQQYVAKRLVQTANTTAFEDVQWSNLSRKGKGRAKSGLNRALATASPARLVQLTKEKAQVAGREVVKVPARNTTQACSSCGVIGERKGLGIRVWTCKECGTTHDRDTNAARNIAMRALAGKSQLLCKQGLPREGDVSKAHERLSVNLEEGMSKRKSPKARKHKDQPSTGESTPESADLQSNTNCDLQKCAFAASVGVAIGGT